MHNDKAISVLNSLIEMAKDGEKGFKTAAEGLKDPQTKALFNEFSRQRGEMARELQDEVRGLGGDPEKAGSTAGALIAAGSTSSRSSPARTTCDHGGSGARRGRRQGRF